MRYRITFGHRGHSVSTDDLRSAVALVDALLAKGWQRVKVNGVSGVSFLKEN